MSGAFAQRLRDAVSGSPLEGRLATAAAGFLELRAEDAAADRIDGPILLGLARMLASQAQAASFLSHRPALLERIAEANAETLAKRAVELTAFRPDDEE